MSTQPKSIKLSSVDVELTKSGNIELIYSHITAEEFKNTMDSKLPEYENTELLYGFIQRLHKITDIYREAVNKLL
tara:strand:+ start:906 stop:1130 length:225 start_codon:yes stop_codon:yes gene_type:complete